MRFADLPTRRIEAWKYSDLRAALDESVQFIAVPVVEEEAVVAAAKRAGIVAALAVQADAAECTNVPPHTSASRVDRPRYANLEPRWLDVDVEQGATLSRVVVQEGLADGVFLDAASVRVSRGATFRQFVLAEGAKLARIETHVDAGEGAKVELSGVYLCGEGRHADLTSVITHKATGGKTTQLIKGVARKGGRGVFQGKIVVERAAQKTDARQHHHGMLLEEGAEIFAKPELMIHADDVACAHGNTAGGLDESALFYLRSRGVAEREARALLTQAFLLEAVPAWLPPEMRDEVEARIAAWLRGAL